MPAPENAAEVLPVAWQMVVGGIGIATAVGGALWKFLDSFKKADPAPEEKQHVILERAELADMAPIRQLVKEFRPALEKINHIEGMTKEMCDKIDRMERAAIVEKEVRDELRRRHEEERWRERDRER